MLKYLNKKNIFIILAFLIIFTSIQLPNNIAFGSTINFTGTTSDELQTAIDNASNGDVIVLHNNVIVTNKIFIKDGKNITITDNGTPKTIKRGNSQFQLITIEYNSTLTLKGTGIDTLLISGHNGLNYNNTLIHIIGGTLNMYDGVRLFGNTSTRTTFNSSAVYVHSYNVNGVNEPGTFNMYGGVIADTTSGRGGVGVTVNVNSIFNMYNGVIANNTTIYPTGGPDVGAGVLTEGIFNMYGGKIINNYAPAKEYYGYVCIGYQIAYLAGKTNLYGGIISDNYVTISNIVISGLSTVNVGSTISLSATVSPSDVTDKTLLWFSSDPDIATVNNGVVTGINTGTVTITAVANDGSGVKATKEITVKSSISSIVLNGENSVKKGDIINLKATILPENANNKTLTWTSSNTNVATVAGTGLIGTVRGISEGTANITATATDGSGKSGTLLITVTNNFISVETNCILLGEKIKYVTNFTDVENDPLYSYNYYYNHNPNYYENSLDIIENNNTWLNKPIETFNKVGHFIIHHKIKDNPPTSSQNENFSNYRKESNIVEKNLYVHRKPIAIFTLNETTVTDKSYDIDHQSSPTKGIVKWEWNYINSNGTILTFTTTNKLTGEAKAKEWLTTYGTVNSKIFLRVQDVEGAWSDWSDDLPVADFIIAYDPMILTENVQKIIDTSYDSKGLPITEYSWNVKKGSNVLFASNLQDISSLINTHVNNNGIGTYTVSLRVKNSNNQYSNTRTQNFEVIEIPENLAPTVDFNLSSRDSWIFPKDLNTNTLYRKTNNLNMFFYEEPIKFNVDVIEPENQNLKYEWEIENLFNTGSEIKKYSGVSNQSNHIVPFSDSMQTAIGYGGGYYRISLKVTDIPVAPYDLNDTKSASVTKYYYIVPELSLTGEFENSNTEIMVGDTIKLKAKTNLMTENVYCTLDEDTYALVKVSEDSNFAYWEKNIIIPDTIIESGEYFLEFVGNTTYGGNGTVTREIRDTVSLNIVALKLINFRITNIVNHPHILFPQTKDMMQDELIPYKTGYYITFQIDSKGKPDNVFGRIDVGDNGSIEQVINMTKITSGDTETWQGRFYTTAYLPINTIISINLDCNKGSTIYDYNKKENWDGRCLIVKGTAFQDGRINLTN